MLAVVCTAPVGAESMVHLSVEPRTPACSDVKLKFLAEPLDEHARTLNGQQDLALSELGAIDLPNGVWRLRGRSERCWTSTAVLGGGAARGKVRSYRVAHVVGTLVAQQQGSAPQVTAEIRLHDEDAQNRFPHSTDCSLSLPSWTCVVPGDVAIDLRLTIAGFAPVYYWDVRALPNLKKSLPPAPLIPGASLSGWARLGDGSPTVGARVKLWRVDRQEGHRTAPTVQTSSNAKGFFQLAGIAAGDYRVFAELDGWAPALIPSMRLNAGETLVWPYDLTLNAPAEIVARVDPPVDADGEPWTVELLASAPILPGRATVQGTTESGEWRAGGLREDAYQVLLKDSRGNAVDEARVLPRSGERVNVPFRLTQTVVNGVVTVGGTPLAGTLSFTRHGKLVTASSDEDGQFTAVFPQDGEWRVTLSYRKHPSARIVGPVVGIESGKPLRVEFPGSRISGKVLTAAGIPVAAAAVRLRVDGKLAAQQTTGTDGQFDFLGLTEGIYEAVAESSDSSTATPLSISLGETETREITLTLAPSHVLRGQVVAHDGSPVGGALIRITSNGLRPLRNAYGWRVPLQARWSPVKTK